MKYAIISDVHSNYDALFCVLEDLKREKIDKIFCCGDIVGYGPDPNECIEAFEKENITAVLGNHDLIIIEESKIDWFNEDAKEALLINKLIINKQNKEYIRKLKIKEEYQNFILVHGSPRDPLFEYLTSFNLLKQSLNFFDEKICFCGHLHIPFVYEYNFENDKFYFKTPSEDKSFFEIKKYRKYIINVGSVGQPRDNNPKSCYVIYDINKNFVEFKRVEYNFYITQQKMRNLKMPEYLIKRLEFGV